MGSLGFRGAGWGGAWSMRLRGLKKIRALIIGTGWRLPNSIGSYFGPYTGWRRKGSGVQGFWPLPTPSLSRPAGFKGLGFRV